MSFTINIYYKGKNGMAKKFANEMVSSGIVDEIRHKEGNLRYEYFEAFDVPLTFGASLNGSGNPQRYFKGTLDNMRVYLID